MSKIISKLNKLNNPESFIQINTIKGFRYVDKAGEIVNVYHKENTAPRFTMNLNSLIIEEPRDKIDQLKITPNIVWARFTEIDSLDMISTLFTNESNIILSILDVSKVSRIGWRNYFVYEFQNHEKQEIYLKKFTVIKNTKPSVVRLEVQTENNFEVNLIIQPVIKTDEQKTPGVLFDVDIFQSGDLETSDLSTILKEFRNYLADKEGFLSVINDTFE